MFLVWIQALAFLLRVILHLACPFSFNPCTEKSSHLVVPTLLGKREKFIPRSADPRVWVLAHSPGCFPSILNRLGWECHRLSSWSNLAFGLASNHDRVKDLRFHKVAKGFHCLVIKVAEVGQLGWKQPHRVLYRPEKKRAGPWWMRNEVEEGGSLARRLFLTKDRDHRILNENPGSHTHGLGRRRLRGYGTGQIFCLFVINNNYVKARVKK